MCFCANRNRMMVGRIVSVTNARIRCHSDEWPGIEVVAVEHDQRDQIRVPAVDENDGADGRENRTRQRQRHIAEKLDVAAAVDSGCFEKFIRNVLEETPQQQDAHRQRKRHLRQYDAEIGVEQPEIAHLDEQRQDGGRRRKQQAHGDIAHQHGAAEKLDLREHESGHRCGDQRQHHGHGRNDERIAE